MPRAAGTGAAVVAAFALVLAGQAVSACRGLSTPVAANQSTRPPPFAVTSADAPRPSPAPPSPSGVAMLVAFTVPTGARR
jgi:hypothetical protein